MEMEMEMVTRKILQEGLLEAKNLGRRTGILEAEMYLSQVAKELFDQKDYAFASKLMDVGAGLEKLRETVRNTDA